jgi:U3 small nucleolar RNA-associated protein 6
MEKVQFQLESTLPELKDLYDKGLFSKHEIDQITKRRTQYETALVRRITRKEDFFKYAEYEINLERLRKVRWKKLSECHNLRGRRNAADSPEYHINPPPPSASTYSLPRRTLYILKRATAKFPGDIAVWLAYVEYAAREGMTKVVAKGLNSAMQHHPLSPTLYLLLSYAHLHPGAPLPRSSIPSTSRLNLPTTEATPAQSGFALEGTQPARTTLLLGLRVLPGSHTLWTEYVKLELGWVEGLRRRWHVLGIGANAKKDKKGEDDDDFDGDTAALVGGDGAFGEEGEEARRAILSGQLVVHAITEALSKVEDMAFRETLIDMLRSYPSPLRAKALGVVYAELEERTDAKARLILTTRKLYDRVYEAGETPATTALSGVAYVDALGAIGKDIRAQAKKAGPKFAAVAGAWLADRTAEADGELQQYLFATLKPITKSAPPALLLRHLELVRELDPDAYIATVRSHAAQHPSNPALQLAHVRAEIAAGGAPSSLRATCALAAADVTLQNLEPAHQAEVVALWRAWAAWEESQPDAAWGALLRASLRLGAGIPALHSSLLASYHGAQLRNGVAPADALAAVVRTYQPTPPFFALAFADASELVGKQSVLEALYGAWRAACKLAVERVDAVLAYAAWLVEQRKGRDAYAAVDVVRREVRESEEESAHLEAGWKGLLDAAEKAEKAEEESGSDEEEEESDEDVEMDDEQGESDEEEEEEDAELDIAL